MKEATDLTIGVVDPDGSVVACSDLSLIGTTIEDFAVVQKKADTAAIGHLGNTFKSLGRESADSYMVFASGENTLSATVCVMAAITINEAGVIFEVSNDKRAFVKTIITENILPGEIYVRAKELRFSPDVKRGVIIIRSGLQVTPSVVAFLQEIFPDKQNDFIVTVDDFNIVLIKEIPADSKDNYLISMAGMIHEKLKNELDFKAVIGVGTPAGHLRELAERYKEALISIDIGNVFDTGKAIVSYESLGIGRLIYQLPTTLCDIFLTEVLKKNPIEALDSETLVTIDSFFENNLNVSETSRKLYVHRNTLVYRLDKIKKITGLDLREFEHAIVFKVALMVKKYLVSQESKY